MKQTYNILILISVFTSAYGQHSDWNTAEKFYYQFKFAAAAEAYQKVLLIDSTNVNVIEKLALCYKELNDPEKAEQWFAKACAHTSTDPKFFKLYAQALASNKKYGEAAQWYAKHSYNTADKNSKRMTELDNMVDKFYRDSALYEVNLLSVNTKNADFGPAFYKDGIVFCSARENSWKDKYARDNSHYIDLYKTESQSDEATSFGSPINSGVHEGPAVFSKNYDTMYFTRNNFVNNRKEEIIKLKIFISVLKNGKWSKAQGVPITQDENSTGHPALSPDQKLYFASDMPGGYGGTDLYFTKFENGTWITPVNLGPSINTSENEMFPFIDNSGTLYFASAGHAGLGGLDIFYTISEKGKFAEPHNIGYPINSSRDDFSFIVRNNQGYFSSNRGNDPQDDNIYSFNMDHSRSISIKASDESWRSLETFPIAMEEHANLGDSRR